VDIQKQNTLKVRKYYSNFDNIVSELGKSRNKMVAIQFVSQS